MEYVKLGIKYDCARLSASKERVSVWFSLYVSVTSHLQICPYVIIICLPKNQIFLKLADKQCWAFSVPDTRIKAMWLFQD